MITLITGLPGNGKTLFAVSKIEELHPNRPIYYYNIKGLTKDWTLITEPELWFNLPTGAVIIFDECQDIFPTRSGKEPVPEKCKRFEIHRKQGHDIYLITQKSRQIDVHVRELVNQHLHIDRLLNANKAQIFDWKYVVDDVNDSRNRDKAVKTFFNYPKEVFNQYHSAEIHTVKRKIPWVIWAIPFAIGFIALAVYSAKSTLFNRGSNVIPTELLPNASPVQNTPIQQNLDSYIIANTPIILGLPYTAPIYSELTKPTIPPIPAACIQSKSKGCHCWTQQGTKISTTKDICSAIIKTGLFIDFNQNIKEQSQPQNQITTAPPAFNEPSNL